MSTHGYVAYRPQAMTEMVLTAAKRVLIEYEAWDSPLTVRQVFYRLCQEYNYEKSESAYDALVGYMARARRAYQHRVIYRPVEEDPEDAHQAALHSPWLIPFSWIRDDKGQSIEPQTYEDEGDFLDNVRRAAANLQVDRLAGQAEVLELWCEAAGMVPLMREIAAPYTLRVSSGGGYDSLTAKHDLAVRVVQRAARALRTRVLHVGDFDPSGEGMHETLLEDVGQMVEDLSGDRSLLEVERIALTGQQVIDLNIVTAPPKPKDSRRRAFIDRHPAVVSHVGSDDITAQLEALTPPDLERLIESAIRDRLDLTVYEATRLEETEIRDRLEQRLK